MTPNDAETLFAFAAECDPSIKAWNVEEVTRRSLVMAKLCEDVPLDFALAFTTRFYQREVSTKRGIRGADIVMGYREATRVQKSVTEAVDRAEAMARAIPGISKAPDWFRPYMLACSAAGAWQQARAVGTSAPWQEARAAALLAIEQVPRTSMREPEFHELRRDERQRDCGTQGCACPHTECRGGFMDAETQAGSVRRCSWCTEAVTMAAELAPKRKGRR